ncbi:MAG: hypothetical protein QM487_15555 [Candidatus Marithrix sp.]
MEKPSITILHKLSFRVRIKFSWPPKDMQEIEQVVMEHAGIRSINYNAITKTALIYFNPLEVALQEIIIRIAVALSKEYGLIPIRILEKPKAKYISPLMITSGICIGVGSLISLINPGVQIAKLLNWAIVGTTVSAVAEHAWLDLKRKGVFDPEVLSVVYLLSSTHGSIKSGALTWIATFGRHLLVSDQKGIELQVFEVMDAKAGVNFYDVIISQDKTISNIGDLMRLVSMNFAKTNTGKGNLFNLSKIVSEKHGQILEGIGTEKNGIILRMGD